VYKEKSKSLQITMRIFIDDLQETINDTYTENIKLNPSNKSKKNDSLINIYIANHFSLKINNKLKPYTYLGKEYENDILYLYLESNAIEYINTLEIKNNILIEMYSNQKNIIKISINGLKKTFFLTKEKNVKKITL